LIGFGVPKSEVPGLKLLAHADLGMLGKMVDALREERPTVDRDALVAGVAQRTDLMPDKVAPLVAVLWRLALVQRRFDLDTGTFLQMLTSDLVEAQGADWTAEDTAAWQGRQDSVALLLSMDNALTYGAKAGELLMEQQLVYCTARILTDARPLFDEKANKVQGFLVFHTLAITYHERGETLAIHIAMDSSDIAQLREQLTRAARKGRIIRDDLRTAELLIVETGADLVD
jgi:hypothetical protein